MFKRQPKITNHYYDTDIWSIEGAKLKGLIPQGYIVYGELVGWTPEGKPIQEHYTYNLPKGTCKLYVYRVAHVNDSGFICDLSWDQVREFCDNIGVEHVKEILRTNISWLNDTTNRENPRIMDYLDVDLGAKYTNTVDQMIPISKDSPCDEGVVVRIEGIKPRFYKAKSPVFLGHETKMLDQEAIDLENAGSDASMV